jgi:hypothetical protein
MTYSTDTALPRWNGTPIKGADAASFDVLTDTLARDGMRVYMAGKPVQVDAVSFTLLSPAFARDATQVHHVLESKLKPLKGADPAAFAALGDAFGRDDTQVWFRDKPLKLSKGGSVQGFAALGWVFGHDGASLFFGTKPFAPPKHARIDWPKLRLKWLWQDEDENEIPPLVLFDGSKVWFAAEWPGGDTWAHLDGAIFDACGQVPHNDPREVSFRRKMNYVQDQRSIWFRDGTRVEGAVPDEAERLGDGCLRQGERLWAGAQTVDLPGRNAAYVMRHELSGDVWAGGDLLHFGDRVTLLDPRQGAIDIARATPDPRPLNQIATEALGPLLRDLFTVLDIFPPRSSTPQDIARALTDQSAFGGDTALPRIDPPPYDLTITPQGGVVCTLACGTVLRQPVSAWYTLGCHLWCHARGHAPELVVFAETGGMLPDGDEMLRALIAPHRYALWRLASAVFRAGAETEARLLGHVLFHAEARHVGPRGKPELVAHIADIPRPLVPLFGYDPIRHRLTATTNLAVAQQVIAEGWLGLEDFRDRMDALGVLHGTISSTDKQPVFVSEIMPAVMARLDAEPHPALRERIGFVLEAACAAGDVFGGADHVRHSEALLAMVEACIAEGIQSRMNHGRRAALLWALLRDDEARSAEQMVVDTWGDDIHWPGMVSMRARGICRTTRLWLLTQKARASLHRAASSKANDERLSNRLIELRAELASLIAEYGPEAATWEDVRHIEEYLNAW